MICLSSLPRPDPPLPTSWRFVSIPHHGYEPYTIEAHESYSTLRLQHPPVWGQSTLHVDSSLVEESSVESGLDAAVLPSVAAAATLIGVAGAAS